MAQGGYKFTDMEMYKKPIDRVGLRVGMVEVTRLSGWLTGVYYWEFRCQCGSLKDIVVADLIRGHTVSCGCWGKSRPRHKTHGKAARGVDSLEYSVWRGMMSRCHGNGSYVKRGIKVCDRWKKFENFLHDMGSRPSKKHSIDRIDNDGDYEPGNCRWATATEQMANTSATINITVLGRTMPIRAWARETGVSCSGIRHRLRLGMSPEEAVLTPGYGPRKKSTPSGEPC